MAGTLLKDPPSAPAGREELIENNMGLAHACANRFRGRGADYDDLFQAGCVGLIKAADGFDPARGFAFSTYAVPVILGEIKRIFRDDGAIKVGRALKQKAARAMREREKLTNRLGREPGIGELAAALGMGVAETAEALMAGQPLISLTGDGDDGGGQIDIPTMPPEEEISDSIAITQVMKSLDERDRKIIELRYFKSKTQSETAGALGMTQVQVSRRERALLLEMRRKMTQ